MAHRIAHPLHPGKLATGITAHSDLAVATSGTAERGAHILNPNHGTPASTYASLTPSRPRLTMTGHLATAAFARGDGAQDWVGTLDSSEAPSVLPDD
ncbi:FAD:protein FMN transferase [Streptomyces sp. NPDC005132]|uniref:FAD:protein FMN transferase n=1 Tax=Streptomyces sp. NPDC005132 TaxID=3154294 RepID=UPI0033ACAF98